MTRLTRPALALAILCLATTACTSDPTTTPSTTTATTVTDTFSGTLFPNGAVSHQFAVLAAGTVTATITQLDGDAPPKIGLGLGTFDVTSGSCSTANGKYS